MELLSIQEKEAIGAKKDRALLSTDLRTLQETVKENRQTLQKREAAYKDLKETYDNVLREKEEQEEQFQNRFMIFSKQMENSKQTIEKLKGSCWQLPSLPRSRRGRPSQTGGRPRGSRAL